MKDCMIIGLILGFIAGAVLVEGNKTAQNLVEKGKEAINNKINEVKEKINN